MMDLPESLRSVRALIFDFDGVIVDTEWAIFQTWSELFARHDVELKLETYAQCVGSDHDAWDPKAHLEELCGYALDWDAVLPEKHAASRRLMAGQGVMDGVVEWLDAAQCAGLPVAVASSSSHEWVHGWLTKLELRERFVSLSCRDHVERIKPAPDLFLHAAAQLEVDPAAALVIEDSANGTAAAHAAGMRVVAVPNRVTAHQDFSKAWRRVGSLAELTLADALEPVGR
ncbi:HAD family hydrolase [Sulfuriroseicoccus oceanibius]|uniref:HAD-IA family hydrolase n=1 Tax=Sulfuriroseicoccus oceanibius TaxID=2707525 RepID=A0A7T7F3C3_9BACT|nr:HAD-IA family hydrolase [Sulfuriroseicoccus oceanibius]QQL45874.1 HAD-IA family hydrolase [Sulfuriroseicoccus oceanibius]